MDFCLPGEQCLADSEVAFRKNKTTKITVKATYHGKSDSFVDLFDAGIREVSFRIVDEVRCPATRERTWILPGLQHLSNRQNLTSNTASTYLLFRHETL